MPTVIANRTHLAGIITNLDDGTEVKLSERHTKTCYFDNYIISIGDRVIYSNMDYIRYLYIIPTHYLNTRIPKGVESTTIKELELCVFKYDKFIMESNIYDPQGPGTYTYIWTLGLWLLGVLIIAQLQNRQ